MGTISKDTNPVAAVWFAILGGTFRLRLDERHGNFADVLDDVGEVIGSANQTYANGGWAVHTKPYAGYVRPDQIEFV